MVASSPVFGCFTVCSVRGGGLGPTHASSPHRQSRRRGGPDGRRPGTPVAVPDAILDAARLGAAGGPGSERPDKSGRLRLCPMGSSNRSYALWRNVVYAGAIYRTGMHWRVTARPPDATVHSVRSTGGTGTTAVRTTAGRRTNRSLPGAGNLRRPRMLRSRQTPPAGVLFP